MENLNIFEEIGVYRKFFNLKENPFAETPDTNFFFRSVHQCNVLARLASMLDEGQGFAMLTGEVGMGKTFLARTLLMLSERSAASALLLFSALEGKELLATVLEEFAIEVKDGSSMKKMVAQLTDFLIVTAEDGKTAVLIVDEAQNISIEAFEVLRMMSNIEMDSKKLLQIILVGQPELKEKLKCHKARQLNQRIGIRLELSEFLLAETSRYIQHRIEVAGGSNFIRWTTEAIKLVHNLSGGVPRLINMQCQFVIENASDSQIRIIDEDLVRRTLVDANVLEVELHFPFRKTEKLVQR